ncbi:kinase-like domain-containing protein [Hypoxylon sp. NC0597]|nr:kinase-like domain-containing protein [Hypoxylon sp. NC0597]
MLRQLRRRKPQTLLPQSALIQEYFDSDAQGRLTLEGYHAKGGQASVYKVKVRAQDGTVRRSLVMKLADPQRNSDVAGLRREKAILRKLRYCKHIVTLRTDPNDPLADAASDLGWEWIYMDELENGTLTTFMQRAKEEGIERLPNRMLWFIFLCLVRSCIALAWPSDNADKDETTKGLENVQPSGVAHNDLHGDNLMFGTIVDSGEHGHIPILKLIDFGLAAKVPRGREPTGEQQNIEDVGIMMATIVGLQTHRKYVGEEIEVDLTELGYDEKIVSPASRILGDDENDEPDPYPDVEWRLRLIIAACMASDPKDRPSLSELEHWVSDKVHNGTAKDYPTRPGGRDWETNESIREIIQRCIHDAS